MREGNIGHAGQAKRLRMSGLVLSAGMVLAIVLVKGDYPVWTRAFIFIPMLIAAAGALQALNRTCLIASHKGVRFMDDGGVHLVAEPAERDRLRKEGRKLFAEALALAGVATGILFFIP